MPATNRPTRILALDPGTKEMGYALLEGESLLRYGVRNIRKGFESSRSRERYPGIEFIKSYKPDVVILGKLSHPENKNNPILRKRANQIKKIAYKNKVDVLEIDSDRARKFLVRDRRPTKMNAAMHIALIYPELSLYIPRNGRILWTYKDMYWMNMFDALTLALAYLQKRKRRKATPTYVNLNNKTI